MKYGIKVPIALDNHGEYTDWLWITIGDSKFQLEPMLFEDRELAEEYSVEDILACTEADVIVPDEIGVMS